MILNKLFFTNAPALLISMAALAGNSVGAQTTSPLVVTYDNVEYKLKLNRAEDLSNAKIRALIERQPWFNGAQSFVELFGGDQPALIYRIQDKFTADSMPVTDDYPGLFPGFIVAIYPSGASQTVVRVYQVTDFGYLGPGDDGVENTDDDIYGPISIVNSTFDNTPYYFFTVVPSAVDSRTSLLPNVFALRNAFNLQSAKIVQGLSYDCMVYDQKNICVSIIGANSDGKGFDAPSGALVVGYKLNDNIRFGAYVDQSFDSASFGGLATDKNDPGYGVYGAWSQNADGSGYQVRAAANISKVDIETTRVEVGFAEAGFGQSSIKSEGIQLDVARSYEINTAWSARPYVGYRKTTNSRPAYVETDSVEAPLSYNMLKQRTEMLVSGVTVDRQISTRTSLSLTAGVEHDLDNRVDSYQAVNEDIGDIEPIAMDSDVRKTRPSVSLGLNHDLGKAQRIGLSVSHRREAFSSESSTSGYVQYSIGF